MENIPYYLGAMEHTSIVLCYEKIRYDTVRYDSSICPTIDPSIYPPIHLSTYLLPFTERMHKQQRQQQQTIQIRF